MRLTKEDYEDIKRMVGMRQTAEYYGYQADRQGRCLCPFHNDGHPSMKIYPHDRGYYCFSCGSGGDVIKFVSRLYGLNNEAAAQKIIEDFALPIKTQELSYREKREREQRVWRRQELERFTSQASKVLRRYRMLLCEALRCPYTDLFDEALQMLTLVDYRLDCLKECPQELYADKKVVRWIGAIEQRINRWTSGDGKGQTVS